MAYDEDLAQQIKAFVGTQRGLSEKKMFGGLALLVGGNMAITASGRGGILVRVGSDRSDQLWVDAEDVGTRRQLVKWVELGVGFARSLPAKR